MPKKTIAIRCKGAEKADISELAGLQGTLKDLTPLNALKLKGEILTLGFSAPFFIWKDEEGGKYILDGHQRLKVLLGLQEDGYSIPKLPIVIVEADNLQQARQKLLAFTSQYGTITPEGLSEYMKMADLSMHELGERFTFGDDMEEQMRQWERHQKPAPWLWKRQPPTENPLPKEEMEMPFGKWLKSFRKLYVMFSGGKDSMALVATLLDLKIAKKKMILVCLQTPLDPPETEGFVAAFSKQVGIELVFIGKKYSREEYMALFEKSGFPTAHLPWCTGTWKLSPWRQYLKDNDLVHDDTICVCLGWRKQESDRRTAAHDRCFDAHGMRMARPILEMQEHNVYRIIEDRGWTLHPAYVMGNEKTGYNDRLGCFYCYAVSREQWKVLREKRPDLWAKSVELLALGCASPNISDQMLRDRLRILCGLDTVYKARKRGGIPLKIGNAGQWEEPAYDPDAEPTLPDEEVTEEDILEAGHFTNA